MTVSEFLSKIQMYANEIGCDGKGNIGSHKIPSSVRIRTEDCEGDYELVDIEMDYLIGCGCPSGITIVIRKEN